MSSSLSLQRSFKLTALPLLLLALCSFSASQTSPRISTTEELKEEFAAVPCKTDRMLAARALFQKMVNHIEKNQLPQYCAMINIDSFGMAPPQVLDNVSNKKLSQLAADTAKDLKVPFNHASVLNADADSSSFNARKIPAVTLHGLNNDWPSILHTRNDQAGKVNAVSVYFGYRLALSLLTRVDAADCAAFR